tara:strand:+ start:225 stop:449 length:225 start_codon:yes stop_codon:yes gene_type:complete
MRTMFRQVFIRAQKAAIMRHAFLVAIPVAATAWFYDHRVAALIGLAAILLSFADVVFDLGNVARRVMTWPCHLW